jgi:hypothetical protein
MRKILLFLLFVILSNYSLISQVVLYENYNFGGKSVNLRAGKFSLANAKYNFDDMLSSIAIESGYVVTIHEGYDGKGAGAGKSYDLVGPGLMPNLNVQLGFNDAASFIEIRGPFATMILGKNKGNTTVTDALNLPLGKHYFNTNLNANDTFNKANYIYVPNGYTVTAYNGTKQVGGTPNKDITENEIKSIDGISSVVFKITGQPDPVELAFREGRFNSEEDEEDDVIQPTVDNKLILTQETVNFFMQQAQKADILRFIADTVEVSESITFHDKQVEIFSNHLRFLNQSVLKIKPKELEKDKPNQQGTDTKNIVVYSKTIENADFALNGGNASATTQVTPTVLSLGQVAIIMNLQPNPENYFPWFGAKMPAKGGNGGILTINTLTNLTIKGSLNGGNGGNAIKTSFKLEQGKVPIFDIKKIAPAQFLSADYKNMLGDFQPQTHPSFNNGFFMSHNKKWFNVYIKVNTPGYDPNEMRGGKLLRTNKGKDGKQDIHILKEAEFESTVSKLLDNIDWKEIKNKPWEFVPVTGFSAADNYGVFLFEEKDFTGNHKKLTKGYYSLSDFDNLTSSIKIPKGFQVVGYEQANGQGKNAIILKESSNDLDAYEFNNKISSIEIVEESNVAPVTSPRTDRIWVSQSFSFDYQSNKYIWRMGSWTTPFSGKNVWREANWTTSADGKKVWKEGYWDYDPNLPKISSNPPPAPAPTVIPGTGGAPPVIIPPVKKNN